MTMTLSTMTAPNMFSEDGMTVNSPCIWRFLKSTPLVFHVFIAVAIMVYLADQNGIEPFYNNRNALPKKRHFLGYPSSAAERPPIMLKKSNVKEWVELFTRNRNVFKVS